MNNISMIDLLWENSNENIPMLFKPTNVWHEQKKLLNVLLTIFILLNDMFQSFKQTANISKSIINVTKIMLFCYSW